MVTKITVPQSLRRALHYNEQKVKEGQAKCLLASGFIKDAKDLSLGEKRARFEGLVELNKRALTNTIHVSLNFAEGEKLPEETLQQIASQYMEKIGFSGQPFLVYEHLDAGHPHLHIVSTNIQPNGQRISLHNLGKGASEKARKELELQYGLVRAGEKKKGVGQQTTGMLIPKAVYGKRGTKRAITDVLMAVLPRYKYASLPELNTVLKLYGVVADRGAPAGIIYRTGGLLYHIVDEQGNKVGMPLKASRISNQPTLFYLEQMFRKNRILKEGHKKSLQTTLDWVLVHPPGSLHAFEKGLQKENILLVIRQNSEGFVYGLTYIDQNNRCVFNGSDLGKAYSAQGVLQRCRITPALRLEKGTALKAIPGCSAVPSQKMAGRWNEAAAIQLLDRLLKSEQETASVSMEMGKQKKKRKKIQTN